MFKNKAVIGTFTLVIAIFILVTAYKYLGFVSEESELSTIPLVLRPTAFYGFSGS